MMELAQSSELLAAKLFVPPLRSVVVSRPRLIALLQEAQKRKLALISASTGSGKTTLLSEWTSQSASPVAWLSLDEKDNDPIRFWTYIVAACQTVHTSPCTQSSDLIRAFQFSSIELGLIRFINDLSLLPNPFTLIIEDYHLITEPAIHATVGFLLDHLPSQVHLILTSRSDPPLALARRRAHREMAELRNCNLRFTAEEISTFLIQVMQLSLSPDEILVLENWTEGWIVGLYLIALSLQNHSSVPRLANDYARSCRHVVDYLLDEVLSHQSEDVQSFLLYSSPFDCLTASLCDTVTRRNDSETMLEYLERANLFIVPLDEKQQYYSYHPLFADALRIHLSYKIGKEALALLYTTASTWYAQNKFPLKAKDMLLASSRIERSEDLLSAGLRNALNASAQETTHLPAYTPDTTILAESWHTDEIPAIAAPFSRNSPSNP